MMKNIETRIKNGLPVYLEDRHFPRLSNFAYELYRRKYSDSNNNDFCIINLNDPAKSHRCNPLLPDKITSIVDAHEISEGIFLSLCKGVEWEDDSQRENLNAVDYITACLWFLKIYKNGKYCTFPHLIEFICLGYDEMFPILGAYPELENLVKPFLLSNTSPIEFVRCRLVQLQNKGMYWIMTGNDFSLDINNPEAPKILCWADHHTALYESYIYRSLCESSLIRLFNASKRMKYDVLNNLRSWLSSKKRRMPAFMLTADLYTIETSNMGPLEIQYQGLEGVTDEIIKNNYLKIDDDIKEIVADEIERIKNDPELAHLIMKK